MKKETILLTGPDLGAVSGVATHLRLLLNSRLKERFDLIHFQIGSQGRAENTFGKALRLVASPFRLRAAIRRSKPALIHLNPSMDAKSFWRDSLYLLVGKSMGCKVIYQLHGGDMPRVFCRRKPFAEFILRKVLEHADRIVLLGDYALDAYNEFSPGLPLNKIPNAIDCATFDSSPKNLDRPGLTLGYIGRLSATKGVLETLEAIRMLQGDPIYEKIVFRIAGTGPAEGMIRRRTETLGIGEKVIFMGPVFGEAKLAFWNQIDLFLFPTYHKEGLPYSLLESLASATPVITTREGGIREWVEEGKHGLYVQPRDPSDIARALRRICGEERDRYPDMSQACLDLARARFGIEILEREFLDLYTGLASSG